MQKLHKIMLIVNSADESTRCKHNTKTNKPTAGLSLHNQCALQVRNQVLTTDKYRTNLRPAITIQSNIT